MPYPVPYMNEKSRSEKKAHKNMYLRNAIFINHLTHESEQVN